MAPAPKSKAKPPEQDKSPPGEGDASLAADMLDELGDDQPDDALRFDDNGQRLT